MRFISGFFAAMLLLVGSAIAQTANPAPTATKIAQPLGVVTADTQVVLDSNKVGVLAMKKWKAGDICTMPAGAVVVMLDLSADGKQRIQRSATLSAKVPDPKACPFGATAVVDPLKADVWKKNAATKEAEKKAKKS